MARKRRIISEESYELECEECGNLYMVTGDVLLEVFDRDLDYEDAMAVISDDIDFHMDHCPQCSDTEFESDSESKPTFKTKA